MDLTELKYINPDLYDEMIAEGQDIENEPYELGDDCDG